MESIKKFYYIYKIICLLGSFAGKYYIGQHQTNNFEDGYAGSGRKINDYYKKYGKEEGKTYLKEILCFCTSWEEMQEKEKEFIGNLYNDNIKECLNYRAGGKQNKMNEELANKIGKITRIKMHDPKVREKNLKHLDKIHKDNNVRNKIRNAKKEYYKNEENHKKISLAAIKRFKKQEERDKVSIGRKKYYETHDVYNKGKHCYAHINNGIINKTITKEELEYYLSNDWVKGRIKTNKPSWNSGKKGNLKNINNGIITKQVKIEELDYYLSNGWKLGNIKKETKKINNGIITKQVKIEELDYYLSNGWKLGMLKRNKPSWNKGKKEEDKIGYIKVLKNHGHKWILPEELDEYINNGWYQKSA